MKAARIDRVIVATPDAARAAETFRRLFGLRTASRTASPTQTGPGTASPTLGGGESGEATRVLGISGAEIAFVKPASGTELAAALGSAGEGMAALRLEVGDIDAVIGQLEHAGIAFEVDRTHGQRTVRVDSTAAHGVRLSLIGRS